MLESALVCEEIKYVCAQRDHMLSELSLIEQALKEYHGDLTYPVKTTAGNVIEICKILRGYQHSYNTLEREIRELRANEHVKTPVEHWEDSLNAIHGDALSDDAELMRRRKHE